MFNRVLTLFCLVLTAPVFLHAQESRRNAIVILTERSSVAQLAAEQADIDQPRGVAAVRSRLHSNEGRAIEAQMRNRKAGLLAAIAATGAAVTGQTETVLNSIIVRATPGQLAAIQKLPGVKSTAFARKLKVQLDRALPLMNVPGAWQAAAINGSSNAGRGIKIAVVDSGIDNTHPMFQDTSIVAPAGFPKFDSGFQAYTGSKLIVARNYLTCSADPTQNCDPRDRLGHGTFVAAIAGGVTTQSAPPSTSCSAASPCPLVTGVAPHAYIGNYRVFDATGSGDDTSVAQAINAAVSDGMDIINLSLGDDTGAPILPSQDTILFPATQAAQQAGALVVASAGNAGPEAGTVASPCIMPGVLCVGSTTNARRYSAAVRVTSQVAVPDALKSLASNPGSAPTDWAAIGPKTLVDIVKFDASGLGCGTLPSNGVAGNIVLITRGTCTFVTKINNASAAGAAAVVVYDNQTAGDLYMNTAGTTIPSMSISNADGLALKAFLAGAAAQATMDPALTAFQTEGDVLVASSSRGPGVDFAMKPEVSAPGEYILSATQNLYAGAADTTMFSTSRYLVANGTSFAAPMVSGVAALVKQARPTFTATQVRSAIVNTSQLLTANSQEGQPAFDEMAGAGRVDAVAAINTPATAEPATLTFNNQQAFVASNSQPFTLTNVTGGSDTFAISLSKTYTNGATSLAVSSTSVSLAAGATASLTLTANYSQAPGTASEGNIVIKSQATGRSIHVPYWISPFIPSVENGGIVNGASFKAGASPGSIISIFGSALASSPANSFAAYPLPTDLGGTSVKINGAKVPLYFSDDHQVNAFVPYDAATGTAKLSVQVNNTHAVNADESSPTAYSLQIAPASPGIFSVVVDGQSVPAIRHNSDGSIVTASNGVQGGEYLQVYCAGLGAVDTTLTAGASAPLTSLVHTTTSALVYVDGTLLPAGAVTFSGLAPSFAGLYQVNVQVPQGLSSGAHSLVVSAGGVQSNAVTLPVR